MPSFDMYKKAMSIGGTTEGRAKKYQSDLIMNETFTRDIAYQKAYFYDFYHDSQPLVLKNLNSEEDPLKVPIDIKFFMYSTQTYDKDLVTFHIQFRPGQKCPAEMDYYNEVFANRYDSIFPLGCYCDILDDNGSRNRWLVVNTANYYGNQFPTYEVLPCEKIIQYIFENKKYQIAGVLRSQNSYNSGVWQDYKIESVEDQQKFILPLNRQTEHIFYNQRFIIDGKVETEPRTWRTTKVNRLAPNGLCRVTLAQTAFDEHKDYIERDSDGNIIGMWADYFDSDITPTDPDPDEKPISNYCSITYSGLNPDIRSGGSFKKFTVSFYDKDGNPIDFQSGEWSFKIGEEDASDLLTIEDIAVNQKKIKFNRADDYIGKVLVVEYKSNEEDISSQVEIEILGL